MNEWRRPPPQESISPGPDTKSTNLVTQTFVCFDFNWNVGAFCCVRHYCKYLLPICRSCVSTNGILINYLTKSEKSIAKGQQRNTHKKREWGRKKSQCVVKWGRNMGEETEAAEAPKINGTIYCKCFYLWGWSVVYKHIRLNPSSSTRRSSWTRRRVGESGALFRRWLSMDSLRCAAPHLNHRVCCTFVAV